MGLSGLRIRCPIRAPYRIYCGFRMLWKARAGNRTLRAQSMTTTIDIIVLVTTIATIKTLIQIRILELILHSYYYNYYY